MSYSDIADIAQADDQLWRRVVAAATVEGVDSPDPWVANHRWEYASQPGWGEAWAYAVDSGADPYDEAVITDGMILSATQGIIAAEATP